MPNPYQDPERERISRKRKIAEAILGQSVQGPGQTQMVGSGPYQIAVPNFAGPIAQIAQALAGKYHLGKAEQEEQAYSQQQQVKYQEWLKGMPRDGTPEEQLTWALSGHGIGGEGAAPLVMAQVGRLQDIAARGRESAAERTARQQEGEAGRVARRQESEAERAFRVREGEATRGQQREQFMAKLEQDKAEAQSKLELLKQQSTDTKLTAGERAQLEREKLAAENQWRNADRQQRSDLSSAQIGSTEKIAGANIAQRGMEFAATLEQKRSEATAQAQHWAQQAQQAGLDAQQKANAEAQRLAWDKERLRLETEAAGQRQQAQIGSTEKIAGQQIGAAGERQQADISAAAQRQQADIGAQDQRQQAQIGSTERIAGANIAQQGAIAGGQLDLRARELQARIQQNEAQLQSAALDRDQRAALQTQQQGLQRELAQLSSQTTRDVAGQQIEAGDRRQAAQIGSTERIAGGQLDLHREQLAAQIQNNEAQLARTDLDRASREQLQGQSQALQRELAQLTSQTTRDVSGAQIASREGIAGAQLAQQGAIAQGQLGQRQAELQAQIQNNQGQLQRTDLDRASREALQGQQQNLQRELAQLSSQTTRDIAGARLAQEGGIAQGQLDLREGELNAQLQRIHADLARTDMDRKSREQLQEEEMNLRRELANFSSQTTRDVASQQIAAQAARQGEEIGSRERIAGANLAQQGAIAGGQLEQRQRELQSQMERAQWELEFRGQEGSLTREHQARLQGAQQAAQSELEQLRQGGAGARQQAEIGAQEGRAQQTRQQQLQLEEVRLRQEAGQAGAQPGAGVNLMELAQQAGAAQGRAKAIETQRGAEEKRREFDARMAETRATGQRAERHEANAERHQRAVEAIMAKNSAISAAKAAVTKTGEKTLTPENAGKVASIRQAISDIKDVEGWLLPKDATGKVKYNHGLALKASLPFGGLGEDARKLKSAIYNATDVIMRLRSGANAPIAEVEKMANTFSPNALDGADSASYKLTRLRSMFQDALATAAQREGTTPDELTGKTRTLPPMPPTVGPMPTTGGRPMPKGKTVDFRSLRP